MNDLIKQLVNYVIEAKIKDYRTDQSAETYRLSRISRETSPSDAPADRASKFAKINADYKSEKRLERAPKGPQTRPVVKKPVEEGYRELKGKAKEFGDEVAQTVTDVKDAIVGGKRVPKEPTQAKPGPSSRPKLQPADSALSYKQKLKKYGYKEVPVEEGAQVPKGAVTGPVRQPTIPQKQQTANPPSSGSTLPLGKKKVGDPASRADWATRKAAMDKAIDG